LAAILVAAFVVLVLIDSESHFMDSWKLFEVGFVCTSTVIAASILWGLLR
jgi:hypothetical protein